MKILMPAVTLIALSIASTASAESAANKSAPEIQGRLMTAEEVEAYNLQTVSEAPTAGDLEAYVPDRARDDGQDDHQHSNEAEGVAAVVEHKHDH